MGDLSYHETIAFLTAVLMHFEASWVKDVYFIFFIKI